MRAIVPQQPNCQLLSKNKCKLPRISPNPTLTHTQTHLTLGGDSTQFFLGRVSQAKLLLQTPQLNLLLNHHYIIKFFPSNSNPKGIFQPNNPPISILLNLIPMKRNLTKSSSWFWPNNNHSNKLFRPNNSPSQDLKPNWAKLLKQPWEENQDNCQVSLWPTQEIIHLVSNPKWACFLNLCSLHNLLYLLRMPNLCQRGLTWRMLRPSLP